MYSHVRGGNLSSYYIPVSKWARDGVNIFFSLKKLFLIAEGKFPKSFDFAVKGYCYEKKSIRNN